MHSATRHGACHVAQRPRWRAGRATHLSIVEAIYTSVHLDSVRRVLILDCDELPRKLRQFSFVLEIKSDYPRFLLDLLGFIVIIVFYLNRIQLILVLAVLRSLETSERGLNFVEESDDVRI